MAGEAAQELGDAVVGHDVGLLRLLGTDLASVQGVTGGQGGWEEVGDVGRNPSASGRVSPSSLRRRSRWAKQPWWVALS